MNGQMQKLFRMFLAGVLMLFTFTVNAQERTITGKCMMWQVNLS